MSRTKRVLLILISVLIVGLTLKYPQPLDELVLSYRIYQLSDEVVALVRKQDPSFAFAHLENEMAAKPKLEDECHDIVHHIGHEAYKKYGLESSFQFQNDLCGSGYIHGIVESYFEDIQGQSFDPNSICSQRDGRCYHGVGHGLLFYHDYDIDLAVADCSKLPSKFAMSNCMDGIFMQYFSTGDATSLSPTAFDICDLYDTFARGSCYLYAPRYHLKYERLVAETYNLCTTLKGYDRAVCVKGVGSGLTKYNMSQIGIPEKFCFKLSQPDQVSCVKGMISYYTVHYNDHSRGLELCNKLEPGHKDYCIQAYLTTKPPEQRMD